MKTQLLCNFTNREKLDDVIKAIISSYGIIFNKIYVFENDDDKDDMMCTFNVDAINLKHFLPNTISLHRKKQTNTLYTINALNALIRKLNNGVLDKTFPIPWEDYRNSILLTDERKEFSRVKISIYQIIDVEKYKNN